MDAPSTAGPANELTSGDGGIGGIFGGLGVISVGRVGLLMLMGMTDVGALQLNFQNSADHPTQNERQMARNHKNVQDWKNHKLIPC